MDSLNTEFAILNIMAIKGVPDCRFQASLMKKIIFALFLLFFAPLALAQSGAHEVRPELEKIPGVNSGKGTAESSNAVCLRKVPADAQAACCTPPTKLGTAACEEAIIKYAEKVAVPGRFTSSNSKAVEAYNFITNCLQSGSLQSDCVERAKATISAASTDVGSCLGACVGNKPGSKNCDTCKQYYGSGGYTERTHSACDSFCVEKTPGCISGCYANKEDSGEVYAAGEQAISDWNDKKDARSQARAQLKALQQEVANQEKALQKAAEEAQKKVEEKKATEPTPSVGGTSLQSSPTPRFKLIETFYGLINPIKDFFKKAFRFGK
jgi:hypothetical protein